MAVYRLGDTGAVWSLEPGGSGESGEGQVGGSCGLWWQNKGRHGESVA